MPRRPDLARRTELAHAAFEVLRARGMQTSMRELADALGVKRPTLYFYFPDLGAVFETVLEQTYRELFAAVTAAAKDKEHPLDRLRAVVDATIAFHRQHPQLIGGLFQLWAMSGRDFAAIDPTRRARMPQAGGPNAPQAGRPNDEPGLAFLERHRRIGLAAREALVADLRSGIARGEVKTCDPERVVELVLSVVDGVLVHNVLGTGRTDHVVHDLAATVIEPLRKAKRKKTRR